MIVRGVEGELQGQGVRWKEAEGKETFKKRE